MTDTDQTIDQVSNMEQAINLEQEQPQGPSGSKKRNSIFSFLTNGTEVAAKRQAAAELKLGVRPESRPKKQFKPEYDANRNVQANLVFLI
jgi:hypothetical protein